MTLLDIPLTSEVSLQRGNIEHDRGYTGCQQRRELISALKERGCSAYQASALLGALDELSRSVRNNRSVGSVVRKTDRQTGQKVFVLTSIDDLRRCLDCLADVELLELANAAFLPDGRSYARDPHDDNALEVIAV